MNARQSKTISVQEGDWDRWTRSAGERGIAERGKAYSVSEYIRRAVESYEHEQGTRADAVPSRQGGRAGRNVGHLPLPERKQAPPSQDRAHEASADVGAHVHTHQQSTPVDTTPAVWARLPLGVQTTPTDVPHALETAPQEVQAEKPPRRPVAKVEAPADESGARHPPHEGCEPDGTFILRHRAGGAQIISPEEAKERVETAVKDTAEPADLSPEEIERVTREYLRNPLRPSRQPFTKESQTKRRGKG